LDLVYWRASREYFSGSISRFRSAQGDFVYGFDIYSDSSESPEPSEVLAVYERLSETMALRPFAYAPKTPLAIERAQEWIDPGFPVYLPDGFVTPIYEVYSQAENYGRIRRFTLAQFEKAVDDGEIGWQDIVVIDIAPTDVETVVAGVVTGTQQGELSHVNVRSLRRGTPNAYVKNALEEFAPHDGQLVKLTLRTDGYEVTAPVDLAEAEAWWDAHRPLLPPLPESDDEYSDLMSLPELAESPDGDVLATRFGGKASGLALLYSFLREAYQVDGFAIPFHYYVEFMRSNTIRDPQDPFGLISFESYIQLLLDDARFRSDTAYRRAKLEHFQDVIRTTGVVDSTLVDRLVSKITEVYGSTLVKVKFRSSSNAEDDVAFNGAGLYDSTSVCAEDTLDGDDEGPSHCQPDMEERTIERGFKRVWASLWNPRAFEEREYFQIDHRIIRMGILVTRAFPAEDSQGVAFTGDPVAGVKYYYVINVQKGDESVVQPGTGVIPEKDLLYITDGTVTDIRRARGSSLLPKGEWVLTEAQLLELGEVLCLMERDMPVNLGGYDRDQVYLDVEFKYQDGALVIKQVRPTLMASIRPPTQEDYFTLRIPEETYVVGVFQEGRMLWQEYEYLSAIYFVPGDHRLPLSPGIYSLDIVERFEFGPERIVVEPLSAGTVTVENSGGSNGRVNYTFEQDFDVSGTTLSLSIEYCLWADLVDGKPTEEAIVFDEPFLSQQLYMLGQMRVGVRNDILKFASPTYESLPLYLVEFTLENGQSIRLYQRWQPAMAGTGPANLVYAEVQIEEGHATQTDYWHLVYAADHHNWSERYWILFDTPIGETYGIAAFTGESLYDREVYTLDCDLLPLRYIEVIDYSIELTDHLPPVSVNGWELYTGDGL
ncbi:MAG: PEP/pyruvate-binding domain-containing protein, partial [bacterium]